MLKFLVLLLANGATVIILANILPNHVAYETHQAVAIFAVILGLLNVFIRPILHLITLPLTCVTLGIFALIVNVAVFWIAAWLSTDIDISYFGAFVGSIVAGVLNGALTTSLKDR